MNKSMLVVVLLLSAAVVLLSATVFYCSRCQCQGKFSPGFNPDNRMSARMPFPPDQEQPLPGLMPPLPNAGGPSEMAPPGGQPDLAGGPNMSGGKQGQGQTGSREQITRIMQEAMQESQKYFMSQNRKPEPPEMLKKVKELMTQKMNAQGIPKDVQQQVFTGMEMAIPPQPPQLRP